MNRSRRHSKSNRRRNYRNYHNSRRHGGMTSIGYSNVISNPQPSERVMQWATTAGAPTPSAAEMRGVAHGGRRKRRCTRRHKHGKHCKGGSRRRKH